MAQGQAIDVQQVINSRPISPLQRLVVGLCFLTVFLDGYDTAMVGFVAPALGRAFDVRPPDLAPVLSAALFGLAAGALAAGPLADRFGRKRVLVGSVALFGFWSLVSAFAQDLGTLTLLRFLTGLGLGAAMPNATTLTAEYCPAKRRAFLVTLMFCGFTLGSAGGGFLSSLIIPAYGWQSPFLVGGVLPLLLALVLAFAVPESMQFLAARRTSNARLAHIVRRIDPSLPRTGDITFAEPEPGVQRTALSVIFSEGLLFGTIGLWVTYFMGLVALFLIRSWLPTLVAATGASITKAAVLGATFDVGGTVGALVVSWFMDRTNPHKPVVISYVCAAAAMWIVAGALQDFGLLLAAVTFAGFCLSGAQTSLMPLSAAFYPTRGRATGVAWMVGVGRFGGILGALTGGALLQIGWSFSGIVSALALAPAAAAAAIWLKWRYYGRIGDARMPPPVPTSA